jgi:hypothetical protein
MFSIRKKTSKIFLLYFSLLILGVSLWADSKQCVWKDVDKIIAVGDIHGAYDSFVKILKQAGVIDENLNWSGGKTHFVQTGDIMDRGDRAKEAFDLLIRLQKEAAEAGGKVHVLLGNHEEMNITGIVFRYDYVSPLQFASFLPDDYRIKKEEEFLRNLQKISEDQTNSDPTLVDSYLKTKWKELMKDRDLQKLYVDTFHKDYGRWLIEQNIVIKINDVVFAHGGVSEKYSTWPLQKINDVMRVELDTFRLAFKRGIQQTIQPEILYKADSPLWNRDIALKDEKSYGDAIDKILKNLGARHMVIAHTPPGSPVIPENQEDEVRFRSRFDKKIWMIDTGIAEYYHGIMSYLLIQNGEFWMHEWRETEYAEEEPYEPSQMKEEDVSREELEYYLSRAAVVDVNRRAVPGRTAPWRIKLDYRGVERRAMFKVIDAPRPESLPESYKYELAAYALDKLLDFNRIPPTVEREIEGTKGSLQMLLENCMGMDEQQRKNIAPPDSQAFTNALDEINVFENLCYSVRQELEDILIHKQSWKIFRVDFSQAFDPTPDLIPEQEITRCSKKLYQNLQDLSDDVVKALLKNYLNEEEMAALISRKASIIQAIDKLIKEKGEAAVLF